MSMPATGTREIFGFRRNASQIIIVGVLTVLCGFTLQLQTSITVDAAGRQFSQGSYVAKLAFLAPFALAKATANLIVGALADSQGRKRVEIFGWCIGVLIPVLVLLFPHGQSGWHVLVASSGTLGLQQGFVWSVTILLYMDLFGPKRRGLASGLNETLGYAACAVFAQMYGRLERASVTCAWSDAASLRSQACQDADSSCVQADDWIQECMDSCRCTGYTEQPFFFMLAMMVAGLGISMFALRETLQSHVYQETAVQYKEIELSQNNIGDGEELCMGDGVSNPLSSAAPAEPSNQAPSIRNSEFMDIFWEVSYRNTSTLVLCVAGFCTNFVTGLALGLISSWARDGLHMPSDERNFYSACYSFLKGMTQFASGHASDKIGRKGPIVGGLLGSAVGLLTIVFGAGFEGGAQMHVAPENVDTLRFGYLVLGGCLIGGSQGLMYPVLAAAISDQVDPTVRASSIGIFRFWRDLGYAAGALIAVVADIATPEIAVFGTALVALVAGSLVGLLVKEQQA